MIAKAQFKKDGQSFGPVIELKFTFVTELGRVLVAKFDHLPDTLDGIKITDWTELSVEITR